MEEYMKQINDLCEWFKPELIKLPPLKMSRAEYRGGVDNLPQEHNQLCSQAFDVWLKEKQYELSYYQMCRAFFRAANDLCLLEVQVKDE